MSRFIESLKRLYESERITKEYLLSKVEDKTLSIEEYNYIVGFDET